MKRLEDKGKGILLLHDIQARTVAALPRILHELKARGYRIVHVVPATLQNPGTPTEPQQWQLHPTSETVAISHWPKIPNFVYADAGMLPAPALSDFGWHDGQLIPLAEPFDRARPLARGLFRCHGKHPGPGNRRRRWTAPPPPCPSPHRAFSRSRKRSARPRRPPHLQRITRSKRSGPNFKRTSIERLSGSQPAPNAAEQALASFQLLCDSADIHESTRPVFHGLHFISSATFNQKRASSSPTLHFSISSASPPLAASALAASHCQTPNCAAT